jgi:tRNA (guanine37-N1)-methyltransferase
VGLVQRAREAGIVSFSLYNPRDRAVDRHRTVDDRPYGGGPGMVMLPGPLAGTLGDIGFSGAERVPGHRLISLSPKGRPLTQALARELAGAEALTLVCGRYEGMDARLEELFPMEAVSVGDFVLNGGEAAALCLVEAVGRLLPGFMGHEESGDDESFSQGLLEYPHYTRPEEFAGLTVPDVLRSGDHGRIAAWRRMASLETTALCRPELLAGADLNEADAAFLQQVPVPRVGRNLYCGLVHYPVLDKQKNSAAVSLTNLDIHDIARSSCTYGLGGYYVITPLEDQRRLLEEILGHWTQGPGKRSNPHRDEALSLVTGRESIESAIAHVRESSGREPLVVGTAARFRPKGAASRSFGRIADTLQERPVLLLFGTGHGLAPEAAALCDCFAPPVCWHGGYNHLSVRAAAAIILDRILGDWR